MLEELKLNIEEFIEDNHSLVISNELSNEQKEFKKKYNSLIRKNVKDKAGVYIWENAVTKEIIYIGMAGRINNKGELKSHSLVKRLTASRGKNTKGKDILTSAFIFGLYVAGYFILTYVSLISFKKMYKYMSLFF